jgi:hypothetical protein
MSLKAIILRTRRHIRLRIAALVLCICVAPAAGTAQSATEDQVKAAYLFNFAKFIEWPAEAFATTDATVNFCTLGRSPAADELYSSVRGKKLNGHVINVQILHGPEEIKGCHLIFLAAGANKQQQKLLQAAKGSPILLVAEAAGFARAGGMINFVLEDGKLLFEINVKAAELSRLKISSKLLTLARLVSPSDERQGQ